MEEKRQNVENKMTTDWWLNYFVSGGELSPSMSDLVITREQLSFAEEGIDLFHILHNVKTFVPTFFEHPHILELLNMKEEEYYSTRLPVYTLTWFGYGTNLWNILLTCYQCQIPMWFLEKYENLIVTFECSYSLPRYCTLSAEFIDRHAATFASWYGGVWTNLFVIDQNLPIWLIEKHADLIPWEDLYPHSGRESQNDIFCESFARKHADRRIWQNIGHFAVSNEFVMEHIEKMNLFRDLDEICARDGNRHSISGTTSWSSLLDNGTTLTQSVFIDMLEKGEMSIITACAWIKHRQLESHILKQLLSKYENNKSNHRGYKQILSKALEHQKSMTTSEMLHTYTASMNKKLMKSLLNNPSFNLDTFKTELIKSHDCGVCCEFAEKLTKQIQNKRISDKE